MGSWEWDDSSDYFILATSLKARVGLIGRSEAGIVLPRRWAERRAGTALTRLRTELRSQSPTSGRRDRRGISCLSVLGIACCIGRDYKNINWAVNGGNAVLR